MDIVWLSDPHNVERSCDARLLSRILAPCERALVRAADAPDGVLWRLWAVKEACFKAISRGVPNARFTPREIVPHWDAAACDHLLAGRPALGKWGALAVESAIEKDVALAWAIDARQPRHALKSALVLAGDAYEAQQSLFTALHANYAATPDAIRIVKDESGGRTGAPAALLAEKRVALSLSHDGPYFAYAFWAEGIA